MVNQTEKEIVIQISCAFPTVSAPKIKTQQLGSALLHSFNIMGRCEINSAQINLSALWDIVKQCDRKIWSDLAVASIATGIRAEAIHLLPFGGFDYELGSERDQMLLLHIAETLGAKKLVVHPGGPMHWGPRCFERDIRSVQGLAALASRINGTILLENTPSSSPSYVGEIVRSVAADNIGMRFDISHYMIKGQSPLEKVLAEYKDIIDGIELSDNDGVHDLHQKPGKGVVPWGRFFACLNDINYQGSLILETKFDITSKRSSTRTYKQITETMQFIHDGISGEF